MARSFPGPTRKLLVATIAAALTTGVSCGGATPPAEPQRPSTSTPTSTPAPAVDGALAEYGLEHVGVNLPGDDICERDEDGELKNPIPEGKYEGLLRNARCEQQKFITMARIAKSLGVECNHCHVPDPNDPKKELYDRYTENKRVANWMYKTFVQGLRPKDGSPMLCASCHEATPEDQAEPKVLKDPRDEDYAQEWMHEVMTSSFVEANGTRLRCKTCHVGMAPDTNGWREEVIRHLRYDGGVKRREGVAGDSGD